MNEIGIVEKLDGKIAKVKIDKKSECDKCGMCMFPKGASHVLINASNDLGAKEGDKVKIEVKPKVKTLGIVLVFLVPLLLIMLCAVIGYFVFESEYIIIISSIISLILWYGVLALIDKKIQNHLGFCSIITEIIKK